MPTEKFTDAQLTAKLQVVLQTWPLYRVLQYDGADNVTYVPKVLKLFCEDCKFESDWETSFSSYETARGGNKIGFTQKTFACRNCGKKSVTYHFYWAKGNQGNTLFFKVGQWPELEEHVSQALKGALNQEDLKLYKNALRLRNFNLGIAAVAYMRRVVENRMNDILEILHESARAHNAAPELLARHEEVKNDRRFSVKVEYAGDLLPENLRPQGQPNPMTILHDFTSDGLHAKSDEECVDIFDECRKTFEYVFGKMRIETEEAKNFVKDMAKLTDKKSKKKETESKPPAEKM
ncbi:MAG TPA: hypothetical protein VFN26_11560 [Candidatus Acidoferrum sp.]|nr:hypothetical protein [Candidatus Acidoferrum sp.]